MPPKEILARVRAPRRRFIVEQYVVAERRIAVDGPFVIGQKLVVGHAAIVEGGAVGRLRFGARGERDGRCDQKQRKGMASQHQFGPLGRLCRISPLIGFS